jgi:hypothetical protein
MSTNPPDETEANPNDPATNSRSRIIADAAERVHQARSQYLRARYGNDESVKNAAERKLQRCVVDYFFALRPLADEGAVKKFWNQPELWTERTPSGEQTIVGLDAVERLAFETETTTVEETGFSGRQTTTVEKPVLLEGEILVRIASALDRAAQLGNLGPTIPSEQKDDHGFGYEDILFEGPPE